MMGRYLANYFVGGVLGPGSRAVKWVWILFEIGVEEDIEKYIP